MSTPIEIDMLPRNPARTIKMSQACFRLPTDLFDQVKQAAIEYDCSQADVFVDALRYYFEQGKLTK